MKKMEIKSYSCLFKNTLRKGVQFLAGLLQPNSQNEDSKRREFILNIISAFSTMLSGGFFLLSIYNYIIRGITYQGVSPLSVFFIFLLFVASFYFSKKGFLKITSYSVVIIYLIPCIYTIYHWGADQPQALISFALIIIMANILSGSNYSFIITFLISSALLIIGYAQKNSIIPIYNYWKNEGVVIDDLLGFIIILLFVSIISWLFNREIEKSLRRARKSEAELKIERDSLEIKVIERTEELQKSQYEKMRQLYRFAEFGRLSSGLLHDLTNYLTALSLNLEKAKTDEEKESSDVKNYLIQAHKVSGKMESFVEAIRRQLQKQETQRIFLVNKEITSVLQIFNYRMKKEQIEVDFHSGDKIYTYGNPLKLNQAITNIISNSFDSFFSFPVEAERKILIDLKIEDNNVIIKVKDNGCGIPEENIKKIFDPFYTTKDPNRGTGIGLSTTKEIVEKDFNGKIEIKSKVDIGTETKITFPIKTNGNEN